MNSKNYDQIFLRYFPLLSAVIVALSWSKFVLQANGLAHAHWIFPMSLWSPTSLVGYWMALTFILVGFIGCSYFRNAVSAVLLPVLWLFALSFESSFGKIDHAKHSYFFVALGYALMLRRENSKKSSMLVAGAVAAYACAGLWKFRALVLKDNLWAAAAANLPHHIAYSIAEGSSTNIDLLHWISSRSDLSSLLWISIVGTQLVAPVIAVLYASRWPWLLIIFVGFHLGTKLMLGILFLPQIILLLWLTLFLTRSSEFHSCHSWPSFTIFPKPDKSI